MIERTWIEQTVRTIDAKGASYADAHPERVGRRIAQLRDAIGARVEEIGRSRSGAWSIPGVVVGDDEKPTIALTGNCHAEEVVGTLTILSVLEEFRPGGLLASLQDRVRIVAIPQMNPDGVCNNLRWLSDPNPKTRLAYCWRDHRAEDVEHGIAEGGEAYRRPEPIALATFYEREAARCTPFYATLHSSAWEAGAYFLTGNEDEGVMAPAWSLIRELAEPLAGLPLYTEDLNGHQNYRRIGDGLYNVPRRKEMQRTMEASGAAAAKGFRLNSLEWMERRGAHVSLVSEVPTILPERFSQEEITNVPALALVAPVYPLLVEAVRRREHLLADLNGRLRHLVADERRLQWATEAFEGEGKQKAERFASFLHTFARRTALRHHESRLVAHPMIDEVKLAGLAVATLSDCSARKEWEQRLDDAYGKLDRVLGLTMTPIDAQVKLQTLLILAGTMVALGDS